MRLDVRKVEIARGGRCLLRGVDATFAGGELVGILGRNGIGKTSLLAALAGLEPPAAGSIALDGVALGRLGTRARARRIAFVDGTEPVLSAVTVREAIAGGRFAHHRPWQWELDAADRAEIGRALDRCALEAFADREIGTLSAGERQRVWIAVAIAQQAQIVLLDEPTSHLDLRYAVQTLELMRDIAHGGAIVIAVLHSLEETAAYCDRVLVLGAGGVLADGSPQAALDAATLARAYGISIGVESRAGVLRFERRLARRRAGPSANPTALPSLPQP